MRPDEAALLGLVAADTEVGFADALGRGIGIHEKRITYLLNKWTDKGWWEYGVSARSGWLTEAGKAAAREFAS